MQGRIEALEQSKMDRRDCLEKLSTFAPMDSLEKFMRSTMELKKDIEKTI